MKVETRIEENMTKSTFGLNGNLKYPETTLKIRKMCGCFANPLENDRKFSPQTSSDFAHAQTLFSSVGEQGNGDAISREGVEKRKFREAWPQISIKGGGK